MLKPLAPVLILALVVTACSAPPPSPPASAGQPPPPSASASQGATANSSAAPPAATPAPPARQPTAPASQRADALMATRADVVARNERTVTMKVGQTLGIPLQGQGLTWQVDYDADRLKPLTAQAKMGQPGEAGWVFRAMAPGLVEIAMTGRVPCATPPCEGNPPKLTFSVEITDRD